VTFINKKINNSLLTDSKLLINKIIWNILLNEHKDSTINNLRKP
jgi:hypothetical protein